MRFKINSILTILYIGLLPVTYAQDNQDQIASQEAADWKYLDHYKNFFCKAPEQCKWLHDANLLEYLRYEDKLKRDKSLVAETFLDKYPNSSHYDDVLNLFLSVYFRPMFIPEVMDSNITETIAQLQRRGSAKDWFKAYRLLPIDFEARNRWLKKGNEFVAKIVNSDTSVERKTKVEIWLYNRDIGIALNRFHYLPKDDLESDYWKSLEVPYWESMWNRLLSLMETYPDSESVSRYIMVVLEQFKRFSPDLFMAYMKEALARSEHHNEKGINTLHKTLSEYLKANKLISGSSEKPLEMAFSALDGNKVDLSQMRGKVILIDFWSTRCPPCISALSHLKLLYDKYRDKGFEIIGISADSEDSKELLLKILKKTNANWPQYLDKGNNATISYHSLYNINSLPTMWLLNKEGVVVDKEMEIFQLDSLINKYLGLNN